MGNAFGFGRRNLNFENHWEELDIETFSPNGAVVLCFGGSQTIDAPKATRFCATAERFVGLKLGEEQSSYKHVDLLGFYYPPKFEGASEGAFSEEQRAQIARQIFLKRCFDESCNLLPIEKVAKNFSLINILSHCWGAIETSYIGSIAEKEMLKLGYSPEEVHFAFGQIRHVSYAPFTSHSPFPFIRVNSFQDGVLKGIEQEYISAYHQKLNGVDVRYDNPGFLMGQRYYFSKYPIISIYTSQLLNTADNSNENALWDEHFIGMLERNSDWTQGHQQNGAKNADLVSKITSYILADAMAVSIRNSLSEELIHKTSMENLATIAQSFCEDYSLDELKTSF